MVVVQSDDESSRDESWGSRLKNWREWDKNWTQEDLKENIEATARRLKLARGDRIDVTLIRKWERGATKKPQAHYRQILAQLGAPLPTASAPSIQLWTPCAEDDEEMQRRNFLRQTGTAVAAAVLAPAVFYGGRQVPSRVDAGHIRNIRAEINALYLKDQQQGGGTLATPALHHYYDARHMLDEARYEESVGKDLMVIAGELAVCVGWLCYDSGDQRKARELYTEAYMLADQSGNTHLAIQATEKMALQSVYIADRGHHLGSAREATRLSARVVELSRYQSSPRMHALIGGRQAIAHAIIGDTREFQTAITRAWREIDRSGPASEDETWLQFVNPSEITVHEAKGYRYLGRPDKAAELYQNSLENSPLSPRNSINYRAQLADCLAIMGDNNNALREGADVLAALETSVASPRTLAELRTVRTLAQTRKHDGFCNRYDRAVSEATA